MRTLKIRIGRLNRDCFQSNWCRLNIFWPSGLVLALNGSNNRLVGETMIPKVLLEWKEIDWKQNRNYRLVVIKQRNTNKKRYLFALEYEAKDSLGNPRWEYMDVKSNMERILSALYREGLFDENNSA